MFLKGTPLKWYNIISYYSLVRIGNEVCAATDKNRMGCMRYIWGTELYYEYTRPIWDCHRLLYLIDHQKCRRHVRDTLHTIYPREENLMFFRWKPIIRAMRMETLGGGENSMRFPSWFAWKLGVQCLWHAFGRTFAISCNWINHAGHISCLHNLLVLLAKISFLFYCMPGLSLLIISTNSPWTILTSQLVVYLIVIFKSVKPNIDYCMLAQFILSLSRDIQMSRG